MPDEIDELGQFDSAWREAKNETFSAIKEIQKSVPRYLYADRVSATETDTKLCNRALSLFRHGETILFNVQHLLFELQIKHPFGDAVGSLKDDLLHFLNRIESRQCRFRPLKAGLLVKLIKHDREFLAQAEGIENRADDLFTKLVHKLKADFAEKDPTLFYEAQKELDQLRVLLQDTVVTFKEREKLCNLEPVSVEEIYNKLRKEIREQL
ncbi:MAG: hypothetical protein KKA90_02330 [Nanoarchaeota archaeon]|nr:hypothetical protein [Nanoarchaeota archaeon]